MSEEHVLQHHLDVESTMVGMATKQTTPDGQIRGDLGEIV